MKKTLQIDWMELFRNYGEINFDEIYGSEPGATLMASENHDTFFLLDAGNHKKFVNYFSILLSDAQKKEIYSFFK
jgi:hypothetical protein